MTWFDGLVDEEQATIGELAGRLLTEKRWEASNGFELTEDIRLTIALQASLLILGLSFDHYGMVKTIIVHPTTLVLHGQRVGTGLGDVVGDVPVLGLSQGGFGPVVIAWDEAQRNARHPERGFDVVFHEFAHKLDTLDGTADGMPPLARVVDRQQWIDVCTAEFEDIRAGTAGTLLWDYAGTNPAEFFAVATEVFFDRPHRLREKKPELYAILQAFYNQDPALQPEP